MTAGYASVTLYSSDDNPPTTGDRGGRLDWAFNGASAVPIPSASLFTASAVVNEAGLTVIPQDVCASTSSISGNGLSLATTGTAARLTITARDEFGNGLGDALVKLQLGDATGYDVVAGEGGEGFYRVTSSGLYTLHASLLIGGGVQATYYSTTSFTAPLSSGPVPELGGLLNGALPSCLPSAQYFSVRWAGQLNLPPPFAAGERYTFSVPDDRVAMLSVGGSTILDSSPTAATRSISAAVTLQGGEDFVLKLQHVTGALGSDGVPLSIRGPSFPLGGTIPSSAWSYTHPVIGTPFSVSVAPARVCSTSSSLSGGGLTLASVGSASTFVITTRDDYGNLLDSASTVCTTSEDCSTGTSLGLFAQYASVIPGSAVDVATSYNSGGQWDALVSGLTVSGNYAVTVALPVVGGVYATYYAHDISLEVRYCLQVHIMH